MHYEYYAHSVHLLYIQLVTKPYTYGFLLQAASRVALCHCEDICEIKLLRQC